MSIYGRSCTVDILNKQPIRVSLTASVMPITASITRFAQNTTTSISKEGQMNGLLCLFDLGIGRVLPFATIPAGW